MRSTFTGMNKRHFIALADSIKRYNEISFPTGTNTASPLRFTHTQILWLADFCAAQNPRFMRERWLDYIAGKCGPCGGRIENGGYVSAGRRVAA